MRASAGTAMPGGEEPDPRRGYLTGLPDLGNEIECDDGLCVLQGWLKTLADSAWLGTSLDRFFRKYRKKIALSYFPCQRDS